MQGRDHRDGGLFFVVYADGDEGKLKNQTTNSLTKKNFSYKMNTSENNL